MTGVMICANGTVDVRRYKLLAIHSNRSSCTLRDEGIVRMKPGIVSSLTADTYNIHGVKAEAFSQIIDIFTPPYDLVRIKESRWFQVSQPTEKGSEAIATILSKP
jgi:hypothetical protein